MTTLKDLINEFGAAGAVFADAGNGSSYGEKGVFSQFDDDGDMLQEYGDAEMQQLKTVHTSDDGFECNYASDWITAGVGDNPYKYRIYF